MLPEEKLSPAMASRYKRPVAPQDSMDAFKDLKDFKDFLPVFAFLLPGFVSTGIASMLMVRKPVQPVSRLVEALIFTTLNLVAFTVLRRLVKHVTHLKIDSHNFFSAGNLTLAFLCALAIGLGWAWEANNQRAFELLRKLGFTRRSTKPNLWLDVFDDEDPMWVVVYLKDGRRVYGYLKRCSDNAEERALYLTEATWLDDEGTSLNDPTIDILLDRESEIAYVELVRPQTPTA